jgi:hypothetical protein
LFYETWFYCLTIFIRYFRGLTLFILMNDNWRQTTVYDNVHVSQMRIQTFPSSGPFYFRNHLFVLKYQKILRCNSKRILQDMVKRKMKRKRSEFASWIHVHCRTVWFVVNCCMRYNDLCCRLRKMCRPSCTFGGSTYSEEQKPDTHHMMYHLSNWSL